MSLHPTPEETAHFESQGYLQLDAVLSADLVTRLQVALETAMERRQSGAGEKSASPGKRMISEDGNRRMFHILDDDEEFLNLIDHAEVMQYVYAFLHETPHFHASDAIWETNRGFGQGAVEREPGWHIDGADRGYRSLRPQIPLLQLKVGYYLSDMTEPDQGNLVIVPGSHRDDNEPPRQQLSGFETWPGAVQVCGPPGTAVMFHNAIWHSHGPKRCSGGQRVMLYYAYEVPWIMGNPEHWSYPREFYNNLSERRRKLFHGFVFDPPEYRFA